MKTKALLFVAIAAAASCGKAGPPSPFGACPTEAQVAWQQMETNLFIHFGPNTFTNREWGSGNESETVFNPVDAVGDKVAVDVAQWVRVAKESGFKGIILTAKHHDGFCLWPNPASKHTIARSPYKDGKGDIVKELGDECRAQGVKFGVYISPWDRWDPHYGTGDAYNQVFAETVESIHRDYEIFEQWFDGAKGEGPDQEYDFGLFNYTVLRINPDAIIFSNVGPGCRWVGNENGVAGETDWSTFSPELHGAVQGSLQGDYRAYLASGDEGGSQWIPSETDVSIRTKDEQDAGAPMWFWNNSGNERVRSPQNLMKLYYQSVGRNSLLLLNVPPTREGRFDTPDVQSLRGFKRMKDEIFGENLAAGASVRASHGRGKEYGPAHLLDGEYDTYFAVKDSKTTADIKFKLKEKVTFNRILLQEYIPLGQRVKSFTVSYKDGSGHWRMAKSATTVGYKRILLTDDITTDAVKISITESLDSPVLNGFGLYYDAVSGLSDADLEK